MVACLTPDHSRKANDMTSPTERAVLAGGCFRGVQDLIRKMPGVISTRVDYSGGDVANATYRNDRHRPPSNLCGMFPPYAGWCLCFEDRSSVAKTIVYVIVLALRLNGPAYG